MKHVSIIYDQMIYNLLKEMEQDSDRKLRVLRQVTTV
jgi:hypothetical protein